MVRVNSTYPIGAIQYQVYSLVRRAPELDAGPTLANLEPSSALPALLKLIRPENLSVAARVWETQSRKGSVTARAAAVFQGEK